MIGSFECSMVVVLVDHKLHGMEISASPSLSALCGGLLHLPMLCSSSCLRYSVCALGGNLGEPTLEELYPVANHGHGFNASAWFLFSCVGLELVV